MKKRKAILLLAATLLLSLLGGAAFLIQSAPSPAVAIRQSGPFARVTVSMGRAQTLLLDGQGLAFTGLVEGDHMPVAADPGKITYSYGRLAISGGYMETMTLIFSVTHPTGYVLSTAIESGVIQGVTRTDFDFTAPEQAPQPAQFGLEWADNGGLIEVLEPEPLPEIPVIYSDEGETEELTWR